MSAILLLSGPPGAGKSTVSRELILSSSGKASLKTGSGCRPPSDSPFP